MSPPALNEKSGQYNVSCPYFPGGFMYSFKMNGLTLWTKEQTKMDGEVYTRDSIADTDHLFQSKWKKKVGPAWVPVKWKHCCLDGNLNIWSQDHQVCLPLYYYSCLISFNPETPKNLYRPDKLHTTPSRFGKLHKT